MRLGCLDSQLEERPVIHIWTSQKAAWFEITDELPQLAEGAPKVE